MELSRSAAADVLTRLHSENTLLKEQLRGNLHHFGTQFTTALEGEALAESWQMNRWEIGPRPFGQTLLCQNWTMLWTSLMVTPCIPDLGLRHRVVSC